MDFRRRSAAADHSFRQPR